MINSVIVLKGLDCPHCADKILQKTLKIKGVIKAEMDFINRKMFVSHELKKSELLETVSKTVKDLEPDVEVLFEAEVASDGENGSHMFDIIKIAVSLVLFGVSFFVNEKIGFAVLLLAFLISGYEVLIEAVRNIIKGRPFDENFLMSIASIGAMIIGEASEGVAVMIFYQVGELFQKIAVESSRKSIRKILELKPETVNLVTSDGIKTVSPDEVEVGDIIKVKAGERIALDGVLLNEGAVLDMSALTGESLPVNVKSSDEILSGSINTGSVIEIRVTKTFENSAVSKLLEMVQNSSAQKAQTEKFITKFARVYTPIVVLSAVLLAVIPPFFAGFDSFSEWIYRALTFLVISCPCALVISVPLSFFSGIGCASRNGILIKGAKFIEQLSKCKTVAFDKTGTITKGEFDIQKITAYAVSENELLKICASVEKGSNHPVAKSIVSACKEELYSAENIVEYAGKGISAVINGQNVLCCNASYAKSLGISVSDEALFTTVCVISDDKLMGVIYLGDCIKETSEEAISKLYDCGIEKTVMLTGDKKEIAEKIAEEVGVSQVKSQLMPADKVTEIEKLIGENTGMVAYAGDGINDAPVIARADVGFAMGAVGSDIAIESADVVIMNDDIRKISQAIKISKKTMSIAKQNIVFALGVKILILVLGALGISNMWFAVFADVGVSFIAVLNALRAMKMKIV